MNFDTLENALTKVYLFVTRTLPDFLSNLVNPLYNVVQFPSWVVEIMPSDVYSAWLEYAVDHSALDLLFNAAIFIFLVRPLVKMLWDLIPIL